MTLLAIIPRVNAFLYSPHSGLGVLLVLASFPWVLLWFVTDCLRHPVDRSKHVVVAVWSIAIYLVLTYPVGWYAHTQLALMAADVGFEFAPGNFWKALTFPLSLAFGLFD
jgi:hypothetical protein